MIEEIAVVGGERIGTVKVRAQSGLRVGGTWSEARKTRALQALRRLAGIKDAEIVAESASSGEVTLRILIQERNPYGIVSLQGQRFWVDREGVLLDEVEHEPLLPVISGLDAISTPQRRRIAPEEAVSLLQAFYGLDGQTLSRFSELHYRGYDVVLQAREGWRALVTPHDLSGQLDRLERILFALQRKGERGWRVIDLRFEGEAILGR